MLPVFITELFYSNKHLFWGTGGGKDTEGLLRLSWKVGVLADLMGF
jgi:hypothetical protein